MKRLMVMAMTLVVLSVVATGTAAASHKGEPQGPHKQGWPCFLDLFTWHCASPGVLNSLGGPSGPSLNWECTDPADLLPGGLCGEESWGVAVSVGPPAGTHFVGTENLIRADLVPDDGLPCPTGASGFVELFFGTYFFCHHYPG